jgi:2,4-dienoyl-CoA reductase-like NADH-dependent reductase (Old Yellow Enzyme family)
VSGTVKLARIRTLEQLAGRAEQLGIRLPVDPQQPAPATELAEPLDTPMGRLGNRWAVLPMEGWDAEPDGRPSELVERRWRRFGESGAKLIWGGEAVAVRADGRANPRQLVSRSDTVAAFAALRESLLASHAATHGGASDLRIGLQLTHSGRFARPEGPPAPRIAYRHRWLDARVGVDSDAAVLSDAELDELVGAFVAAAVRARDAGFDFVDLKHCHGYLGHELLSAVERPGPYGGDLAGRSRFLRLIAEGIRRDAPELALGVRLSLFDHAPYRPGESGVGECEACAGDAYPYAFGGDGSGRGSRLDETHALLDALPGWGIRLLCTTAGSPYYNPHIQRPAFHPPSDGYQPPEDPLLGCARQLEATAAVKARHPELVVVASGLSYLQEWLPAVAAGAVASGGADLVGIGRMALSYPGLPSDVLAGRPLERRLVCRTFSDCTTAPRAGLVSGCYPLDEFYAARPEAAELARIKRTLRKPAPEG